MVQLCQEVPEDPRKEQTSNMRHRFVFLITLCILVAFAADVAFEKVILVNATLSATLYAAFFLLSIRLYE